MKKRNVRILIIFFTIIAIFVSINVKYIEVSAADNIYYSGTYKKKISGITYYFSMNEYTGGGSKLVGCYYVFAGKTKMNLFEYDKMGEFYQAKRNTYRYKNKKGLLIFKIQKNKMIVRQKGKVLSDIDLSGSYKCIEKYPPS